MPRKHLVLSTCLGALFAMPACAEGIDILGQHYSQTLKNLADKVEGTAHKKLVFTASQGGDNQTDLHAPEFRVSLRPGSKEDNVAHELMHALLAAEGFPDVFFIDTEAGTHPRLYRFFRRFGADLHHFIINRRLEGWGYDSQRGFLKEVDSYKSVLKSEIPDDPTGNALATIEILHQLTKFAHYIGDAQAESEILKRFPKVARYWQTLKSDIARLPFAVKPQDLWLLGRSWFFLMDRIAKDVKAPIAPLEILGMEPAFIPWNAAQKPYEVMFREKQTELGGGVRLHLIFCEGILTKSAFLLPDNLGSRGIKGRTKNMSVKAFSTVASIKAVYY